MIWIMMGGGIMIELTLTLLKGAGFLAFIALVYGLLLSRMEGVRAQAAMGVMFGIGAVISMLDPTEIMPGVVVDSRSTLVLLSGFFGGPVAAVITWVFAAAYRAYLGGVGNLPGQVIIALSAILGLAFHYVFVRGRDGVPPTRSLLYLALATPVLSAGVLVLPLDVAMRILGETFIPVMTTRVFGTLALGFLIVHEMRRIRAEAEVRRLAYVDELSGLANRRAFFLAFQDAWRRWERYRSPFMLILMDVDHFKSINDRYGHPIGDEVIRRLSRLMEDSARSTDVLARIGGEEFVILLPNTTVAAGRTVAERMRQAVEAEILSIDGHVIRFTISAGVSAPVQECRSLHEVLSSADQALYEAKRSGRNRIAFGTITGRQAATVVGAVPVAAMET